MSTGNTPSWNGRRTVVTGAAGFIGSHLAEALVREGAVVRAFVRYNSRNDYGWLETLEPDVAGEIEIFRGDLENPDAVTGALDGRDVVFHLGALIPIPYSYRHPREFVAANVVGTLNILEAARRLEPMRVVHTSTSEVYGTPLTVPIGETHALNAQSPYAASKVGADQLALSYHRSFGTPVVIVRPFNTYGPRQSARAVIPTVIAQALGRDRIQLGATETTRDFLYVGDTVAGFIASGGVEAVEGEVMNLGTGVETSVVEVVERVTALTGTTARLEIAPDRLRPPLSEVERLVADTTKARQLLDWQPAVAFDEGLARTIEWMRGALGSYKPTVYNV